MEIKTVQKIQGKSSKTNPQRLLTALSFTSGTITVAVSQRCLPDLEEIFTVHKCVLYSDDQLNEECEFNDDRSVKLTADPRYFKAYMTWLYTRRLPEFVADPQQDTDSSLGWLTASYGLACNVDDPRYQDVLVIRILSCARDIESFPNITFFNSLYSETRAITDEVLGRKLMVDLWAWKARPEWEGINYLTEVVCEEFAGHLRAALMYHRKTPAGELVEPWASSRAHRYLVVATHDG